MPAGIRHLNRNDTMRLLLLLLFLSLTAPVRADHDAFEAPSSCGGGAGSTRCEAMAGADELAGIDAEIANRKALILGKQSLLTRAQKTALRKAFSQWEQYALAVCEVRQQVDGSAFSISAQRCMLDRSREFLADLEELTSVSGL